jgi:hypothetical protein
MEVIVDGKVKLSKLKQSANITFPIVVNTHSDKSTLVITWLFWNASSCIPTTT